MDGVAREFADALNREVTYSDIPPDDWERELKRAGLPEHLTGHLVTMGELHRAGRYDRLADGVERVTGRPAMNTWAPSSTNRFAAANPIPLLPPVTTATFPSSFPMIQPTFR